MRQKVAFVVAATAHGTVILNRLDWRPLNATHNEFGVGTDILVHGAYDLDLISITGGLLLARREARGPGVIALDVGANIGIYTLEWARQMEGWGSVIAFEPQERIYYALAGNIAINNLFNARAVQKAVGSSCAMIDMPVVDYQSPGQFGGLSLGGNGADIGQASPQRTPVEMLAIDTLGLPRLDFLKLDIEGMEPQALVGAANTIERSKPYLLIEWHLCGKEPIERFLDAVGYEAVTVGMNMICAPKGDQALARIRGFIDQATAAA